MYRLGAMVMEEVTSNITFDGASATLTGQSTVTVSYTHLTLPTIYTV